MLAFGRTTGGVTAVLIRGAGEPGGEDADFVGVEGYEVGTVAGGEVAEAVGQAEKGGGGGGGEAEGVGEGHGEEADAVAHRACHVERRAGEGAVFGCAAALADDDLPAVEAEITA